VEGVKWRVVYFGKLVFESDEQEFSLRGVKSKKISSYPERVLLKSVLKVKNVWVKVDWLEREEELRVICIMVVGEEDLRCKSLFTVCQRRLALSEDDETRLE